MNQSESQSNYFKVHLRLPNFELLQKEIADQLKPSLAGAKQLQADFANNPIFQQLVKQHEPNHSPPQTSSDEVSTEEKRYKSTARMGKLQTDILLRIAQEEQEDKLVQWSPSKWFGTSETTDSQRSSWSKSLKKLEARGLVIIISAIDINKLSMSKQGARKTYVKLTQLGRKAVVVVNKNCTSSKNYFNSCCSG
ncbi:hypothetical protein [Chlorogloea sp. CCALA 695]|uniref:hypothetical protein n=1 Tax=Chlorogloea sp. CCALA 695 TaxID=2107693 RepID=UPI000D0652EC|nr:hypothetical protein [Chlorogloea sp. CCALA 695]PSB29063.1 hypothetical protein C7B70_19160 [Chlorogloea sp. CCALA 695]